VRAALLALLAFAIFGPLLNLVLWAFAEKWYFPSKLPLEYGPSRSGRRVFRAARQRAGVARHERVDRVADGGVQPRGGDSRRLRARAAAAAVARRDPAAFLLPQAVPNLPVYVNIAQVFYQIGLAGTITGVVLVHASHGLVLAVWIASAAFAVVDGSLEEAARNMGASPWTCFRTVTLPLAAPGLMASAIFVFLESLGRVHRHVYRGRAGRDDAAPAHVQREHGRQLPDRVHHGAAAAPALHRVHARGRAVPEVRRAGNGR
jgi:ABC-type proline/glycine betaine transport system permease subunit